MSCISLKRLTFMFVIACVVWCSSIGTYIARKGNYRKGRSKWNPPHKTTPKPKAPTHSIPPPSIGLKSLTCDALEPRAFQDAWSDACKVERSTVLVPPKFTFLVGPVSFSGANCQPNIVFQLDGIIIAPTDFQCWGNGSLPWLEFTYLRGGVTVQGKGILDGRGSRWWKDDGKEPKIPLNTSFQQIPPIQVIYLLQFPPTPKDRNEFSGNMPRKKPTGITIRNSPQFHLKFNHCKRVVVHVMTADSPGDSPNTDGIHLHNSQDVLIHSSNLSCGDDCISIQSGSTNVSIFNVSCGPGHGISIGGLGRNYISKACVSNITFRNIVMHNTTNGARIKTWQGGRGSVQGVVFSNIQVSQVVRPIVINQFYCGEKHKTECRNQTAAVALSGITFEKIRGTYKDKAVDIACSDNVPCRGITLSAIELTPAPNERPRTDDTFCWQAFVEFTAPMVPPIGCLKTEKLLNNKAQSNRDVC
ncbi:hypothetical protein ES288_A01G185100v1 [Gossypium darwinii]|uniref:Polygalacturonase n=1 Tax=Gossypium darwinii TaxID=34276 RepID=A0A5D2HPH7_GOSDA|nr:hypothetical protein ES288_A01G185100v1 [Gossypium darwinii]